jgi:hypothetical protein
MLSVRRRTDGVKLAGGGNLRGTASLEGWQAFHTISRNQCEFGLLRSWEMSSHGALLSSPRHNPGVIPLSAVFRLRGLYSSFDGALEVKSSEEFERRCGVSA